MAAVVIDFRAGAGGLFDRVRWRCSGNRDGCGLWYAAAWDWAPAMAAEHMVTCHGGTGRFLPSAWAVVRHLLDLAP